VLCEIRIGVDRGMVEIVDLTGRCRNVITALTCAMA
jgi:hypothetical protein